MTLFYLNLQTNLLITPSHPNNLVKEGFLEGIEKSFRNAQNIQVSEVFEDLNENVI